MKKNYIIHTHTSSKNWKGWESQGRQLSFCSCTFLNSNNLTESRQEWSSWVWARLFVAAESLQAIIPCCTAFHGGFAHTSRDSSWGNISYHHGTAAFPICSRVFFFQGQGWQGSSCMKAFAFQVSISQLQRKVWKRGLPAEHDGVVVRLFNYCACENKGKKNLYLQQSVDGTSF